MEQDRLLINVGKQPPHKNQKAFIYREKNYSKKRKEKGISMHQIELYTHSHQRLVCCYPSCKYILQSDF